MTKPLDRKDLYELVWSKPMTAIAKEYGLSDRGLAKLCERNSIPVPPRGYWAKKQAGQKVHKVPLIIIGNEENGPALLQKMERAKFVKEPNAELIPAEIQSAIDAELAPTNKISPPKTLHAPHPIIEAWIIKEKQELENYKKCGGYFAPTAPNAVEKRCRLILSTLFKELEKRGFKIKPDENGYRLFQISLERDLVFLKIAERIRQERRLLTPEERTKSWNTEQKWTQTHINTGKIRIQLAVGSHYSFEKEVEDTQTALEDRLNEIIANIILLMCFAHQRRHWAETAEQKRREQERERARVAELKKAETERRTDLEEKAENWIKANNIRMYVAAVTKKFGAAKDNTFMEWEKWALKHADRIDPVVSGNFKAGNTGEAKDT